VCPGVKGSNSRQKSGVLEAQYSKRSVWDHCSSSNEHRGIWVLPVMKLRFDTVDV